jgi:hypothetical protein
MVHLRTTCAASSAARMIVVSEPIVNEQRDRDQATGPWLGVGREDIAPFCPDDL